MKFFAGVIFLLPLLTWARPTVLVSHYDAFGGAAFNNSANVAIELAARFAGENTPLRISTCALETKFDTSLFQLEDCLNALPEAPVLVLGLGESGCQLKVELMGRNLDKTYAPDNAGIERNNQIIVPGAPEAMGFTYPLADMYCALTPLQRKQAIVSNSAGSFVCNNTAFQFSLKNDQIPFGFIHVPGHKCKELAARTRATVDQLEVMLIKAIPALKEQESLTRLPISKAELKSKRERWQGQNDCKAEFYGRARGYDESSFWRLRSSSTN